jgi:hypothetical protein
MSPTEQHPRSPTSQRYIPRQYSVPEAELTAAPLFREAELTSAVRRQLYDHLASVDDVSGRAFGELYQDDLYVSVSEKVVYGARGTSSKLAWVMTTEQGLETVVPSFVARCLNLTVTTDPLTSARFKRDTLAATYERRRAERARRAGRSSGEAMGKLRDAENVAAGRLLHAESVLADAISATSIDARAELIAASVPWTAEFEAEQDRLFEADQDGQALPPLSARLEAASDRAVEAAAVAETMRSAVAHWNSPAAERLRADGYITAMLPPAGSH